MPYFLFIASGCLLALLAAVCVRSSPTNAVAVANLLLVLTSTVGIVLRFVYRGLSRDLVLWHRVSLAMGVETPLLEKRYGRRGLKRLQHLAALSAPARTSRETRGQPVQG